MCFWMYLIRKERKLTWLMHTNHPMTFEVITYVYREGNWLMGRRRECKVYPFEVATLGKSMKLHIRLLLASLGLFLLCPHSQTRRRRPSWLSIFIYWRANDKQFTVALAVHAGWGPLQSHLSSARIRRGLLRQIRRNDAICSFSLSLENTYRGWTLLPEPLAFSSFPCLLRDSALLTLPFSPSRIHRQSI
jgi:hypothetical protein